MRARLRLLLLPFLAVLLAALVTGCGDAGSADKASTSSTSGDPRAVVEKAFATPVKSGVLEVDAAAAVKGAAGAQGPFSLSLKGPFKSRGTRQTPLLDWTLKVRGAGQDQTLGLIATEDNAFVKFRGQTYEVGKQLFRRFVTQARHNARAHKEQSLRSLGVDPARWVKDTRLSAGPDVGGDPTRKVTGSVDVRRMVADVSRLLRSPELRRQLKRQGQDPGRIPQVSRDQLGRVAAAVKKATFEVDVDDQDVARRVRVTAAFKAPAGSGATGAQSGTVRFSYALPQVGGDPDIKAPTDAKPLQLLIQQLGLGAGMPGGGALKTQ